MREGNKIAFNTGVLYIRMIATILISLFSTRVILNELGAADFGLYNVIGGVVSMLVFINVAMATATQRYISYNMGVQDTDRVKKIFANSVMLHLFIGIVLVIVFESIGMYLIKSKLKIDNYKLGDAKIVLHFVVISTFVSIISVPFDALVIAHQNMLFDAFSGILDTVLKLVISLSLIYVTGNKLLTYGFLLMLSAVLLRIIKQIYCRKRYTECRIGTKQLTGYVDKALIKEMTSFASWNLFGILCTVFRNQGVSVVLNLFYGTVVNAAYGIANQVNAQMGFFSQSMMKTINPQMMKSEGAGDRQRVLDLSVMAGKFSFYLFSFFAIPLFIEMHWILGVWLKKVPEYTVQFCRLILILTLIQQLSMGIMAAIQAIGKIKTYQAVAGTIQLFTLPLGYFLLTLGHSIYSVLYVAICLEVLASGYRLYYFNRLTKFSIYKFIREVVGVPTIPFLLTSGVCYCIFMALPYGAIRVVTLIFTSFFIYGLSIYFIAMNRGEKQQVVSVLHGIKNKLCKR